MGGYGSGPGGYSSKMTVEGCRTLDINSFVRHGVVGKGYRSGSWVWTDATTGEQTSAIGYTFEVNGEFNATLRLQYTTGRDEKKRSIDYPIRLQTTRPNYGGKRWWFHCPLIKNGRSCNRRVGRLYLPSGGLYFGCSHCYDLTYTSCQESHKFDSLLIPMAARLDCSVKEVKNFF